MKDLNKVPKFKIQKTTPYQNMNDNAIWSQILRGYLSEDAEEKILASVLNAIATESKSVIFLSKKIVSDILKGDNNTKRKTLNGTEFRKVLGLLFDRQILKNIEKPTRGKKGWNAGVFEVIWSDFLSHNDSMSQCDLVEIAVNEKKENRTKTSQLFPTSSTGTPKGVLKTAENGSAGVLGNTPPSENGEEEYSLLLKKFMKNNLKLPLQVSDPEIFESETQKFYTLVEEEFQKKSQEETPRNPDSDNVFEQIGLP